MEETVGCAVPLQRSLCGCWGPLQPLCAQGFTPRHCIEAPVSDGLAALSTAAFSNLPLSFP